MSRMPDISSPSVISLASPPPSPTTATLLLCDQLDKEQREENELNGDGGHLPDATLDAIFRPYMCGIHNKWVIVDDLPFPPKRGEVQCTSCGATGEAIKVIVWGSFILYQCRLEDIEFAAYNKGRVRFYSWVGREGRPARGIIPPSPAFKVVLCVLDLYNKMKEHKVTLKTKFFSYDDLPPVLKTYLTQTKVSKGVEVTIPDNIPADPRIRMLNPNDRLGVFIGRPERLHLRLVYGHHPAAPGRHSNKNDPIIIADDDEPNAATGSKRKRAAEPHVSNKKRTV